MSLPRADNQWFAVLASDGLWDVFSNQEAADMILEAMLTVATPPLRQRGTRRVRLVRREGRGVST